MSALPPDKAVSERPALDQERQKKAREYSRIRRRLSLLETGISLVLILILIFSGLSNWFAGLFDWPVIPTAVVYFVILIAAYEVLTAPLSYYRGFILPHRYGISTQKLKGWLMDLAKGGAIGLVFSAAAVTVVYWLLLYFPDIWWLLAWSLMLIVSVFLSVIAPIVLVPLFYKVKPLADGELKSRLEKLAEKAGAGVRGIFILDFSSKVTSANAALMGIGRTRRIVISDTLIQQYSVPEIESVTAHEIGHHMHRDVFRLFIIQSVLSLIVLKLVDVLLKATAVHAGFSGIADPSALPLLLLLFSAVSSLFSPLTNSYTRHVESQADGYALDLTDSPQAFIDAMTRLVNQNLAVANPPQWEELLFYTHPSYHRRVEHARIYEATRRSSSR
jgi:STE24 endopeptidase